MQLAVSLTGNAFKSGLTTQALQWMANQRTGTRIIIGGLNGLTRCYSSAPTNVHIDYKHPDFAVAKSWTLLRIEMP